MYRLMKKFLVGLILYVCSLLGLGWCVMGAWNEELSSLFNGTAITFNQAFWCCWLVTIFGMLFNLIRRIFTDDE